MNSLSNQILIHLGLTFYLQTYVASDCSGRVNYGGCVVPITDAPWTVGLVSKIDKRFKVETPFCTGTVLDENWILTSAHCTIKYRRDPAKIIVIAGADHKTDFQNETLVQRRTALKIHHHPDYIPKNGLKSPDASLIHVDKLTFTERVMPMKLWDEKWPGEEVLVKCEAFGWGIVADRYDKGHTVVYTNSLRKTSIRALHGLCPCLNRRYIQIQVICSHPSSEGGICAGDSGGPLVCKRKLAGIAYASIAGDCRYTIGGPRLPCNSPQTMNLWLYVCPVIDFIRFFNVTSAPEKPENCRCDRQSPVMETVVFWLLMLYNLSESWS